MSLINQVLKDLERRRAPAPQVPSRANRTAPRHMALPAGTWWLLGAVITGVALHWGLSGETPMPAQTDVIVHAGLDHAGPDADSVPANFPVLQHHEAAIPDAEPEPVPALQAPLPNASSGNASGTDQDKPTEPAIPDDPNTLGDAAERAAPVQPTAPSAVESERPGRSTQNAPARTLSIERANPENERSDVDAVRRTIARGHHQRAESQLQNLLDEDRSHDDARELLAVQLQRRGEQQAAIALLEQGLDEGASPARFARQLGRILLDQEQPERARQVMTEHAPASGSDADFLQVLAAAHRQAGDHPAAESAYRQLIGLAPQRVAAWIGLAASLEALERPSEAHQAYVRVLESGDPQAVRFARQRLHAIENDLGDHP